MMKKLILLLSICFVFQHVFALEPVHSNYLGSAIQGYDPVAYFKIGKAKEGISKFTFKWNGATWYFANEVNRDEFKKEPEKYAPQYGGYCAWAVSNGYTAKTDPEAWTIYQGKLYLNYNKSVQSTWSKNIPGNVKKGDRNWPKLLAN